MLLLLTQQISNAVFFNSSASVVSPPKNSLLSNIQTDEFR